MLQRDDGSPTFSLQTPQNNELTYIALKQHHCYEHYRDAHKLQCTNGAMNMNQTAFQTDIKAAFGVLAAACDWAKPRIINYEERHSGLLGLWNHGAHFDDVFTVIWDGFPIEAAQPGAWLPDEGIGARDLVNKSKYNACIYKGHLGIGFHGCILGESGLHLGVDHDMRLMNDMESKFQRMPHEWHMGDLGYVGAEQVLYPMKRPAHTSQEPWNVDMEFLGHLISFYRGRVENVIGQLKSHKWARGFRGALETMQQYYTVALVLTAAEIRHNFESTNLSRFEVVGPWDHTYNHE